MIIISKINNTEFSVMSLYRSSGHDINPSFTNFVRKIDQEIIWDFCVIKLLYPLSAHNLIIHFISFEELSCVDCQNVAQYTIKTSQYFFTNKPSRVIEIIGIRKDAIHEPIPGHQLIFFVTKCCFISKEVVVVYWPLGFKQISHSLCIQSHMSWQSIT